MAMMRNDRSPPTDVDTTAKPGVGSTTLAPRAWSWWLAAVFVAPLAAGAFASYELNALWNANEDLSARRDVARRLAGVISTLKDAETGQRGYLLTADPAYLKPYADAIAALPHETAALAESIATIQPEELGPVAQMKAVIDEETAELARTIALAAEGQQAAALAIVRGSLDKRLMDGVRALVAGLEARVDNQIDVGMARRRTLEYRCAYGLAATIASTLFLIALLWQSQRQAIQASERLKREMDSRRAAESGREQAFRLEFQARRHCRGGSRATPPCGSALD